MTKQVFQEGSLSKSFNENYNLNAREVIAIESGFLVELSEPINNGISALSLYRLFFMVFCCFYQRKKSALVRALMKMKSRQAKKKKKKHSNAPVL